MAIFAAATAVARLEQVPPVPLGLLVPLARQTMMPVPRVRLALHEAPVQHAHPAPRQAARASAPAAPRKLLPRSYALPQRQPGSSCGQVAVMPV